MSTFTSYSKTICVFMKIHFAETHSLLAVKSTVYSSYIVVQYVYLSRPPSDFSTQQHVCMSVQWCLVVILLCLHMKLICPCGWAVCYHRGTAVKWTTSNTGGNKEKRDGCIGLQMECVRQRALVSISQELHQTNQAFGHKDIDRMSRTTVCMRMCVSEWVGVKVHSRVCVQCN